MDKDNINKSFMEFDKLKDGWMWGEGKAFNYYNLEWLKERLLSQADCLPNVYLYPAIDGCIRLEYCGKGRDINIDVDIETHNAEMNIYYEDGSEEEIQLNLDYDTTLKWLCDELRKE